MAGHRRHLWHPFIRPGTGKGRVPRYSRQPPKGPAKVWRRGPQSFAGTLWLFATSLELSFNRAQRPGVPGNGFSTRPAHAADGTMMPMATRKEDLAKCVRRQDAAVLAAVLLELAEANPQAAPIRDRCFKPHRLVTPRQHARDRLTAAQAATNCDRRHQLGLRPMPAWKTT